MKQTTLIALVGLLALNCPAHASSFDCAKAQTQVEKLICTDAELSKLDDALAMAYAAALKMHGKPVTIRQAQKQWLKERNKCGDVACVKASYESRIASLPPAQAFTVIEDDITPNFPVLNEFCQTMAENLNSTSSWPPAYCERPLNAAFTKLKMLQWREWTVEEFDKRWYLLEQSMNDESGKSIAIARRGERWTDENTQDWRAGIRRGEAVVEETQLPERMVVSAFDSRRLLRIRKIRNALENTQQYRQEKGLPPLPPHLWPGDCNLGHFVQLSDDGLTVNTNARSVSISSPKWQLWLYEFEPGKYALFDQQWGDVSPGFETGVLTHSFDTCKILYTKPNSMQRVRK